MNESGNESVLAVLNVPLSLERFLSLDLSMVCLPGLEKLKLRAGRCYTSCDAYLERQKRKIILMLQDHHNLFI